MIFAIVPSGWVKQTGREQSRTAISGVEKDKIYWMGAMRLEELLLICKG
jgi:hypothetical protein